MTIRRPQTAATAASSFNSAGKDIGALQKKNLLMETAFDRSV
jgi:hypothetical protein